MLVLGGRPAGGNRGPRASARREAGGAPGDRQALEALRAPIESGSALRQRTKDFEDFGITAAARRYLREEGEARTTREIADALVDGGLKTKSKNWIATVYATLRNGRMFKRTKDDKWELAEEA